ncbi:hypothetical protein HGO37_22560 [Rhizobium sp. CG4]|uniref:hypothetical protein n=1 Tax=unclassified Rhizobium TaxID=2613769 RepID=UPI0020336589|nr:MULTISPECIES: hypothetical protein [unclassified Rhizobium]MCM2458181.1 hypothetical protein [Rhizobium sp. CG4]MCS4243097.1 hypothetical protein [Rhizobium sp. BIGb0125]
MTALSYFEYAADLHARIGRLRGSAEVAASIEIAICRNGYFHKSEETTGLNRSWRCSAGPLNSPTEIKEQDGIETKGEIEAFFALPVIYAYSDFALSKERSPLAKSHWDGTVALIEVRYTTAVTTWHQRMLFIGFADSIHADFTVGLESDLFATGQMQGKQLFEWRTAGDAGTSADALEVECKTADLSSRPSSLSLRQRIFRFTGSRLSRPTTHVSSEI